jgi:cytoskeletal protein RodZ
MPDKWPSLYEQLGAVTAAPIPFFIALIVIAWIAWRAWQWRFKAVFEKQKELYEFSRLEVDHWKERAKLTTEEATRQIEQIEVLQRPAAAEEVNAQRAQIDQLKQTISRLTSQLNALGQANSSAASTGFAPGRGQLSGIPPPPAADWTSSGWKPRNPK